MADRLSSTGRELADALGEVLDDVSGAATLPGRVVKVPDHIDVRAIRKRLGMTQRVFSARFGIDCRLLQDWEQGRRSPAGAARAYLVVIDRRPDAVEEALASETASSAAE